MATGWRMGGSKAGGSEAMALTRQWWGRRLLKTHALTGGKGGSEQSKVALTFPVRSAGEWGGRLGGAVPQVGRGSRAAK